MYRALFQGTYIIEYIPFSFRSLTHSWPPNGRLWDFPSQNRTADSESPFWLQTRCCRQGSREFHLLPLALAGGWAKTATSAPALPRSFPLLRGHLLPTLGHAVGHALFHATADTGATGTVPAKSAD